MHRFLRRFACASAFVLAGAAHAAADVPAPLEPWRAWVLHGQEFRACPLIAGRQGTAATDYLCAWPGLLDLRADAAGASVAQHWRVEAESWVPLPGDASYWPQQVTVDGQPAPLVDHDGPALRLAAGSHDVRARIPWQERPQTLRVPASVGLVALTVDGKTVAPVVRKDDELTLGRSSAGETEADSIELHVYRKLADGIPAILTTEIRIAVSGQAREEIVGPVLPEGFAPLTLASDEWPARLDADGRLHVQVQPGATNVTLDARALAPLAKVVARVPGPPWPKQEIWSYAAAPQLRVTSATSALQVDPRQADVDEGWLALPAFAMGDGATISVDERSRGLAPDEKNRLTLDREMWLDFAGEGYFARDRIRGDMLRGWRFDVASPFVLERADASNANFRLRDGENLLVTRGAEPGTTGVEWRTPAVDLDAGVRVASAASALPVTGWSDSFDRVTTRLHLPSGYRLIGAPGADSAAGSWLSKWTLLDVFIAAIVALLAWRLFGLVGAAVAVAYLVLGYQESGAPIWTLLAAIALGLVARALPQGRLATAAVWTRRAALLLLVLVALPFVADQLRYALHPQLEGAAVETLDRGVAKVASVAGGAAPAQRMQEEAPSPPPPASPEMPETSSPVVTITRASSNVPLKTVTVTGSNVRRIDIIDHYSESTVVQTGSGEPAWNLGSDYLLTWSGPVLPAQSVRLVVAPPWLVRVLRVVLVALLAALILRLVRTERVRAMPAAGRLASLLVAAALCLPSPSRAQSFPPDSLLAQLRSQLAEAPACVPTCATIANADVAAHGDEIVLTLQAHAAAHLALPLPDGGETLSLRDVRVDGAPQDGLARDKGTLEIALARGVHRIELAYVAGADKATLRFPVTPMRIGFTGEGWKASGINENHLLTETLALARARAGAGPVAQGGAQQFAPFVDVHRDITLGLNWSMSSYVRRMAPKDGGFTVSVPALAGEHVASADVRVEGGQVLAAIADGAGGTSWQSTLDKSDTLTLTAPPLGDRTETWSVTASPIWHVGWNGVPVSPETSSDRGDFRRFEFHPLPGEKLTLTIGKPAAADGAMRAIDRASLVLSAGQRASDAVLDLSMRASQGGEHVVTLPKGVEILNVTRDGKPLNLRPIDGRLSLPLVPGTQRFQIRFREPVAAALRTRTPAVALGLPAANVDLGVDLPSDRWLLATFGPSQGPAVLYWSELAVMLLVAWALARTRRTPLRLWQWILLGLGFSTFSWIALVVVVGWLFALDWRARGPMPGSPVAFNLTQIGLVALTLMALFCLAAAIPQGLLGSPDMHVAGNGSSSQALRWFVDRTSDALPAANAISVPLWVYKVAMLAWALWLANAVVGWLRDGFAAWSRDGYWRALPRNVKIDIPTPAPPPPGSA